MKSGERKVEKLGEKFASVKYDGRVFFFAIEGGPDLTVFKIVA